MRFAQFTDWKLMERTVERERERERNLTRFHFVPVAKLRVIFSINSRREYFDIRFYDYSLTFGHFGNLNLINLSS